MDEPPIPASVEAQEPEKKSWPRKLHIGFGLWLAGFFICKLALYQLSLQGTAGLADRIAGMLLYMVNWSQGPLGRGFLMLLILWSLAGAGLGNLRLHHAALIAFSALLFLGGTGVMSGPVFIPALLTAALAIIWAARKEKLKWRWAFFYMITLLIIGSAGQLVVSMQHSLS